MNTGRSGLHPIDFIHSNPSFSKWLYWANITFALSIFSLKALSICCGYFSDTLPLRLPSQAFFLLLVFLFIRYSSNSFVPTDLSGTEKDGIIAWVVLHMRQRNLKIFIMLSK